MAVGVLALLKAQPERAEELGRFLADGRDLVLEESETVTWHAFRVDAETYGVFDTFEDEAGRQAHMSGELAARLGEAAAELLAAEPEVSFVEIIAAK